MKKITLIISFLFLLTEINAQSKINSTKKNAFQLSPNKGNPQSIMKFVCNCCNSSTLTGGLADQVSHGKSCCVKKLDSIKIKN